MDNQPIQPTTPPTPQAGSTPPPHPSPLTTPPPAPSPVAPPTVPTPPAPTPTPEPTPAPAPSPVTPPVETPDPQPVAPQDETPVAETAKKPKKTGLIVGIICAIIFLLGCIGFAVFAVIKSQPENILASSLNNLINTKNLTVDGSVKITIPNYDDYFININLNSVRSGSDYFTNASAQVSIPGYGMSSPVNLEVSEVLVNNGNMYFKVKGTEEITDLALNFMLSTGYNSPDYSVLASEISEVIEDRWIQVSVEDLLSGNITSGSQYTNQTAISTYNCLKKEFENLSDYSGELTSIFQQNPFIIMQQQEDSFYKLSVDSNKLAGYINALPSTKLASDTASCMGASFNSNDVSQISSEDVAELVKNLPSISARFDGFFDHHLSELKISSNTSSASVDCDLKLNYANLGTISAPSDATSIQDIITEIESIIQKNMINLYSSSSYNTLYDYSEYDTLFNDDEWYYDDLDTLEYNLYEL